MSAQDNVTGAVDAAQQQAVEGIDDARDGVELLVDKLQGWLADLIVLLPNLVVAVVILTSFVMLSKLVAKVLANALSRTGMAETVVRLLSRIAFVAVIAVGLFFALGILQLEKTVTSLLAGAGVIGLALAFAFQDMAANFMAGIYMSVKRPFEIGHIIETNDVFATVQEIDLRATVLRTPQGQLVRIPNKQVCENKVTNYSQSGERRVDLEVGVSYGEDLERVREVATAAIEPIESRDSERPVEVIFTGFGGSSIDLVVRFWVDFGRQSDFLKARDAAIVAIKVAFDANDIVIPFPIRTLDFGIKGGGPLRDELVQKA
jgi:small-conductance mechanosensitive channel